MTPVPLRVAFNGQVLDWAVRAAHRAIASGNGEAAARWALVGAQMATRFGVDRLVDPELERALVLLGARVPPVKSQHPTGGQRRWLHVMSEAHGTGGHTALVARWIENNPRQDRHDLVLTFQNALAHEQLAAAIHRSGGTVTAIGQVGSLLDRAAMLRSIAWHEADVVVLHIHQWDVVAAIAFAVEGGPPVIFLDHADHSFWIGVSIADAVISLRRSGEEFARSLRGVRAHLRLPIPLPERLTSAAQKSAARAEIREAHGIPADAVVMLTVGSEMKYTPVPGLDFLEVARDILRRVPTAYLIAVGPRPGAPGWEAARTDAGGRIIAVGQQRDLWRYHAAADLHVEGFPFGSMTALLEAGAAALPVIRAPATATPPFVSDGEALDPFPAPRDPAEFVTSAVGLLHGAEDGVRLGLELGARIAAVHQGAGWAARLGVLESSLPTSHCVQAPGPLEPPPLHLLERWAELSARLEELDPVWFSRSIAEEFGLVAAADASLSRALRARQQYAPLYSPQRIAMLYPAPLAQMVQGLRLLRRRVIRLLRRRQSF